MCNYSNTRVHIVYTYMCGVLYTVYIMVCGTWYIVCAWACVDISLKKLNVILLSCNMYHKMSRVAIHALIYLQRMYICVSSHRVCCWRSGRRPASAASFPASTASGCQGAPEVCSDLYSVDSVFTGLLSEDLKTPSPELGLMAKARAGRSPEGMALERRPPQRS